MIPEEKKTINKYILQPNAVYLIPTFVLAGAESQNLGASTARAAACD